MKGFIDDDFLLHNDTARELFHNVAKLQPIIDYHCHLNPAQICENAKFGTITKLWLGGDHYKWRLMRAAGVDERFITGNAGERDKFQKWAETLAFAIGNPLYHWSHLELKRYFGFDETLDGKSASRAWELCNEKLASNEFTPRNVIMSSNVEALCTTDDPADSLEYHQKLKDAKDFKTTVLPAWRPDKALNIEKPGFTDYIGALSKAAGVDIKDMESLKEALFSRMDYFHQNGCRLSDHALEYVMYVPASEKEADGILKSRLAGESVNQSQALGYRTYMLQTLGRRYNKLDWAMQLHYGCKRDNSPSFYRSLGPDAGFDCMDNRQISGQLADFLASFGDELPRTIVYSLNPNDDDIVQSVVNCFQTGAGFTKVHQGSAWWFNDHIDGMEKQMRSLANNGYLAGFLGMLTDSRSFISYPRHEYFRRILCNLIGKWVEDGMFPRDRETLGLMVKNICCENARAYFRFPGVRR